MEGIKHDYKLRRKGRKIKFFRVNGNINSYWLPILKIVISIILIVIVLCLNSHFRNEKTITRVVAGAISYVRGGGSVFADSRNNAYKLAKAVGGGNPARDPAHGGLGYWRHYHATRGGRRIGGTCILCLEYI